VRRLLGANGPELHRAADPARDQSYFLFATTREQARLSPLPVGRLAEGAGA
jgi:tRNA-specific 2-thiouridylase